MWDHDCGCVPVRAENGDLVGILTDRDVCMAAYTQNRPLSEIAVRDVMSKDVKTCALTDSVEVAEKTMQRYQLRRLPVVDADGQLVGILSLNDLARAVGNDARNSAAGLNAEAIEATLAAVCRPRARKTERGEMPQ